MEIIYEAHGIEIVSKDKKLFFRYDAGELVHKIREIEISEKESMDIQLIPTSQELYDYMIKNLTV